MSYIKIIGEETHYNVDVTPFTSQHGKKAVRFVGDEIPETDKGFKMYDDNDQEISDLSAYKFIYRQNEYTTEKDDIEQPGPNNDPLPMSSFDKLASRVSNLGGRISNQEYKESVLEQSVSDLEDSLCEYSAETESAIADIEDSLCELSENVEVEE